MKFISWNVNGLRAVYKKGFLDFFNKINADIFCIQETKMQQDQIDDEIKNTFENFLDETEGKLVNKVNKSLEKLLKCQYEDFINAIKDE